MNQMFSSNPKRKEENNPKNVKSSAENSLARNNTIGSNSAEGVLLTSKEMFDLAREKLSFDSSLNTYLLEVIAFVLKYSEEIDMIATGGEFGLVLANQVLDSKTAMKYYYTNVSDNILKTNGVESLLTQGEDFDFVPSLGGVLPIFSLSAIKAKAEETRSRAIVPDDIVELYRATLLTRAFCKKSDTFFSLFISTDLRDYLPPGLAKIMIDSGTAGSNLKDFWRKLFSYFKDFDYGSYDPYGLILFLRNEIRDATDNEKRSKLINFLNRLSGTLFHPSESEILEKIWILCQRPTNLTKYKFSQDGGYDISNCRSVESIVQYVVDHGMSKVFLTESELFHKLTNRGSTIDSAQRLLTVVYNLLPHVEVFLLASLGSMKDLCGPVYVESQLYYNYDSMSGIFKMSSDETYPVYQSTEYVDLVIQEKLLKKETILGILFSEAENLHAKYSLAIEKQTSIRVSNVLQKKISSSDPKKKILKGTDLSVREETDPLLTSDGPFDEPKTEVETVNPVNGLEDYSLYNV